MHPSYKKVLQYQRAHKHDTYMDNLIGTYGPGIYQSSFTNVRF